jgi:hypothetical protein
LLYGHENLSSPRYDIALLATELSAEESRRLPLGEERDAAGSGKNKMARYVLWTALVAAVAAILGTLIRLLRSPASV